MLVVREEVLIGLLLLDEWSHGADTVVFGVLILLGPSQSVE